MPTSKTATQLFAVGPTWAQFIVYGGGPPRSVLVEDLTPDTTFEVNIDGVTKQVRTLTVPPGPLLARIATLSDIHVGETKFGALPRVKSVAGKAEFRRAHPVPALRAALGEIDTWAPDALIVKGDLTNDNTPAEYEFVVAMLLEGGRRVIAIPGNHDGGNHSSCDTHEVCAALGLPLARGVSTHNVGQAQVVTVDSVVPGMHKGTLSAAALAVPDALVGGGSTLLVTHHQMLRRRVQLYLPRGVPMDESTEFLDAVARANPRTLITSGHTHRHRRMQHGPITFTEVGAPKDYPATWAQYEVYEGGIVQTVRRIADPAVLAWSERAKRSALGVWGRWAPGRLSDRCFTVVWDQ